MTNLEAERKTRGWTQAKLARQADMNQVTVGQIESGRFIPYPSQLQKLARALRLPLARAEKLLERVDEDRLGPAAAKGDDA